MRSLRSFLLSLAVGLTAATTSFAQPQPSANTTLNNVRSRGALVCGINATNPPFSVPDPQTGGWRGFEVDMCRAMAAAVFGDAAKASFRVLTPQVRFAALQSGEVDVLFSSSTWTNSRETLLGLAFTGTNFHSGLGFIVKRSLGVESATGLNGATICIPPGSTTELAVGEYFREKRMRFTPVIIEDDEQLRSAFIAGRCDAMARDSTGLAGFRVSQGDRAADYVLLPELIALEPLGAFVRKGDGNWFDVARWTLLALIAAEQLEVTQANVDTPREHASPEMRRLLGQEGDLGRSMGLDNRWAAAAIRAVGNYGEIWERHVGPTGLARGLNRLWNAGGLHYAPPYR